MKERKELLERYIDENFDRNEFKIKYLCDWLVTLTDCNHEVLSLCGFAPGEVWVAYDNAFQFKTRLNKKEQWEVIREV